MIRCSSSSLCSHDGKVKLMRLKVFREVELEKQIKKVSGERNNLVGNNSRKRRKASSTLGRRTTSFPQKKAET